MRDGVSGQVGEAGGPGIRGAGRHGWRGASAWIAMGLLSIAFGMIAFLFASTFFLPGADRLGNQPGSFEEALSIIVSTVSFVALPSVGAILAIRRPGNPIGWLLLVSGVSIIFSTFGPEYVARTTILGTDLPGHRIVDLLSPLGLSLGFVLLPIWVPLLFPDGHLPSPRWRPIAWAAAVTVATNLVALGSTFERGAYGSILPNPIKLEPDLAAIASTWVDVSNVLFIGFIAAAMGSLVVRFRRSRRVEREQIKWFLAAILVVAMALVAMAATQQGWAYFAFLGAISLIPVAIGIAVLRYRLYEIDRIISRTIGWAVVTGLLVGSFVLLVLGLQAVLAPLTGGSTLAVAGSTLVVAALFAPVRSRVQRAVDRRFDRSRYDGERLLADFGERLRDEVDLVTISRDARATVDAAVRPATVELWLRGGSEGEA
jgi:hypothetical protein